jgi:hypothetical protein
MSRIAIEMHGRLAILETRKLVHIERTATVLQLYRAVGAALMEPPHKIQIWRIEDPKIEPEPNGRKESLHLDNKSQTLAEAQLLDYPKVWVIGAAELNRRATVETVKSESYVNDLTSW